MFKAVGRQLSVGPVSGLDTSGATPNPSTWALSLIISVIMFGSTSKKINFNQGTALFGIKIVLLLPLLSWPCDEDDRNLKKISGTVDKLET